jgi:hypothetical protein
MSMHVLRCANQGRRYHGSFKKCNSNRNSDMEIAQRRSKKDIEKEQGEAWQIVQVAEK